MSAPDALIGYTGFVGSTLRGQREFGAFFNSSNFRDLRGRRFGMVVCAGVPAEKWLANKDPENDRRRIGALREELATISADLFVLISTVDVYPVATVQAVDEDFDCGGLSNHAYGRHRLEFENFVRERFPLSAVVRLPALFGKGLKKNAIYDLLNDNAIESLTPEGRYQWYDVSRLWTDLSLVIDKKIKVVNLVTEPVVLHEIVTRFFADKLIGQKAMSAGASYDIRTRYSSLFGRTDGYVAGREEVFERLGHFIDAYRGGRA